MPGSAPRKAASVYRALKAAGLLQRFPGTIAARERVLNNRLFSMSIGINICHINICGTFYYLCTIPDGYSRAVINWGIGEQMTESDVELIIEQAKKKYPEAREAGHHR